MSSFLETDRRVLVLAFARMADALGGSFLIVVLPTYIASGVVTGDAFGLSVTLVTGIVLSLFGFVNSLAQPYAGRFSDRTGRRKPFILAGLGILALSSAAYAVTTTYAGLVVVRAIQGLGVALTIPCTIALVNELATTETRGGNMGVFNTFRLLGFGLGPVAAGTVVHAGPYRLAGVVLSGFEAAFYLAAATAAVSYAMVWFLVRDPEETKASAAEDLSVSVRDESGGLDPVFTLGLVTLGAAIAVALFATLEQPINHRLDQSTSWFGLQFGAFVLVQVVLQTPVGSASDRFGRRPFILAGTAVLVPATLAQGFVVTSMGLLAARLVQGVGMALVFAPALALAGDLAGEGESGTTLSVLTMAFGLGTAIGPLSSGFLYRFGYAAPFAFGAALAAANVALVYTQVEETVPIAERDRTPAPQD